jgi:UDP-N-acetyl-D-galactosamine dehydrogenase
MQGRSISVIGLGYVGLPMAVAFGKQQNVIAFDINKQRIEQLKNGIDVTKEVIKADLEKALLQYTSDKSQLVTADFHIVAVPTPIDSAKKPNLIPLLSASKTVGSIVKKGDIVVYESTVYPGTTEEECVPVLEAESGLKCGVDFFVGYSPERINPGDKEHTFTKITKVVSGQTPEVLEIIAEVYESVVEAGVYRASSIKVAEAAKVIENSQRDINIAFVNELAKIFNLMNINTYDVLEAANSKWNFLPFKPGLVGGHCIGVDPYYLTYKAEQLGYHPEVILAGRRINDGMGKYVAELAVKEMLKRNLNIKNCKVAVLGVTFKENCPDVRNTKVIDIVDELKSYHLRPIIIDPEADTAEVKRLYNLELSEVKALEYCNVIIIAVAHTRFLEEVYRSAISDKLIIDVKNLYCHDTKLETIQL